MIIKGKRWNIQKKTEEVKDNNTKKVAKREKKAIKPVKVIEEPVVDGGDFVFSTGGGLNL